MTPLFSLCSPVTAWICQHLLLLHLSIHNKYVNEKCGLGTVLLTHPVAPDIWQIIFLDLAITRGTTLARWALMSLRSCLQLWTAWSRTSWCLIATGVELLNLMRWIRLSMQWVSLLSVKECQIWNFPDKVSTVTKKQHMFNDHGSSLTVLV